MHLSSYPKTIRCTAVDMCNVASGRCDMIATMCARLQPPHDAREV